MEINVACGATPATPSGAGCAAVGGGGGGTGFAGMGGGIGMPCGAAVISDATMVPWASQSDSPSPPVM